MEPPKLNDLVKEARISSILLDQKCSDEHLNDISLFLDWRRIAPHLGLSEAEIQEIDDDQKTLADKRLKTLQKWKSMCSYKATYKHLVEVLLKVRNADHAGKVCRMLQSPEQGRVCRMYFTLVHGCYYCAYY